VTLNSSTFVSSSVQPRLFAGSTPTHTLAWTHSGHLHCFPACEHRRLALLHAAPPCTGNQGTVPPRANAYPDYRDAGSRAAELVLEDDSAIRCWRLPSRSPRRCLRTFKELSPAPYGQPWTMHHLNVSTVSRPEDTKNVSRVRAKLLEGFYPRYQRTNATRTVESGSGTSRAREPTAGPSTSCELRSTNCQERLTRQLG